MEFTVDFFNIISDFGDEWVIKGLETDVLNKEVYIDLEYGIDKYYDPKIKANLISWADEFYRLGIKELQPVILRMLGHIDGVVNAMVSSFTNAMAERLNGKIQEIKLSGRGYRKFENFRSAILFFHGKLNLIPLKW